MPSKAEFKSDAFDAIRASASALRKVAAIAKVTMRSFDESCLNAADLQPRTDQAVARSQSRQRARARPLSQHQRKHGREMGGRRQAPQRHGTQAARHSAKKWVGRFGIGWVFSRKMAPTSCFRDFGRANWSIVSPKFEFLTR